MTEPAVRIRGGFWGERLAVNKRVAVDYQWQQLERTGCIDNFRIAAGLLQGCRQGLFFSDSDAYKWLDAASRLLDDEDGSSPTSEESPALRDRVDELISLIESAQCEDGYLYTYNQILFPGRRWVNLQLEHELYCLGHLIEAGVSHRRATGETRLLERVRRSADLLVRDFMDAAPEQTDGHEEIELALIRLHRLTEEPAYLELARRFLERRGRARSFLRLILPQVVSTARRLRHAQRHRKDFEAQHPEKARVELPPPNKPKIPPDTWLRVAGDLLSGRNFQQHLPLRGQDVPVGHAVRFTYLETAAAMLCREIDDPSLRKTLERAWDHLVTRRMYVTGGLGSLPLIEGFGRDYELDPEIAYAETCAAIGGLLWNREMAALTGEARYDDLFEWQLYNAASVGMAIDGRSYLYNNPLSCRGGIRRVGWYLVPCCPSNLSRIWATLGEHVFRASEGRIDVCQYFSSRAELPWGTLTLESELPWSGTVRLTTEPRDTSSETSIVLRLPAWSGGARLRLNGNPVEAHGASIAAAVPETACGYAPQAARTVTLRRKWASGDELQLELEMPIRLHRQDRRVRGCGGRVAISRGPLVYCLESTDNSGDIFQVRIHSQSLKVVDDPELLGGIRKIIGYGDDGRELTFIPYMLWGNRGASQMTVFVDSSEGLEGRTAPMGSASATAQERTNVASDH